MLTALTYRVFVENRTVEDIRAMIKANPDTSLRCEAYTDQGFIVTDAAAARAIKTQLRECVHYSYQRERVAQRNAGKRHQTGALEARWRDAVVIITPNPEGQHLMR